MTIKSAYLSKQGRDYKISPHFKLSEMAHRGGDKVLYDTVLINKLEELRAYGGFTITINSGYRSPAYNASIGGASKSQHLYGTAADIVVKKDGQTVNARLVCCLCQTLGFKGVAFISDRATHVDVRTSGSYRGDERKGYSNNVSDFYSYFGVTKKTIEALKVKAPVVETPKKEEGEEVTQEQFNQMMDTYLKGIAEKEASEWSGPQRKWAESLGVVVGDGTGKKSYQSLVTKEQVVTMMYQLLVARRP